MTDPTPMQVHVPTEAAQAAAKAHWHTEPALPPEDPTSVAGLRVVLLDADRNRAETEASRLNGHAAEIRIVAIDVEKEAETTEPAEVRRRAHEATPWQEAPGPALPPETPLTDEDALLGGLLVFPEILPEVQDLVTAADFEKPADSMLYVAMLELHEEGAPVNILTVASRLEGQGQLGKVGGHERIASLAHRVPSGASSPYYARRVAQAARHARGRRLALSLAYELERTAPENAPELLERAAADLEAIATGGHAHHDDADEVGSIDVFQVLADARDGARAVPTGLIDLDGHLIGGGLQSGALVYVAGRPGMGKTAFAVNVLTNAALTGHRGMLVSYEVPRRQLAVNIACLLARVSVKEALEGKLDTNAWEALREAAARMTALPLRLVDGGAQNVEAIAARARAEIRTRGLDLLAVDYLQLVTPPKAENRALEVALMSRRLKLLSVELEIPTIVVAQLNRAPEHRSDPRPRMSDLRESGALEQDADLLVFPFRADQEQTHGVAELIVAKQRNGPKGTILAAWDGPSMAFADLDRTAQHEYRQGFTTSGRGGPRKASPEKIVEHLRDRGRKTSVGALATALGVADRTLRKYLADLPDDAPVRRIVNPDKHVELVYDPSARWEEQRG